MYHTYCHNQWLLYVSHLCDGKGHAQRPALSFAHSLEEKNDADDVLIALWGFAKNADMPLYHDNMVS